MKKINKENSNLISQTIKTPEKIQIQESSTIEDKGKKFMEYMILQLIILIGMWSTTKAEDLRSSLRD